MAFEFAAGKLLGDIVVGVLGNLAYDASGQVARGFARQVTSLLAAADGQRNDELLRALRYAEAEALAAVCDLWLAGQGIPEALLQRQLGRRLVGCTGWLWRPHDRAIDRCIELWRSAAKLARSLPKADGDQLDRLGVTELGNVTELLAAANELGPIPGPVLKQRLLDAYWSHLDSQHFLPPGFEKYLRDRWFELLGHSFRSYLTHHPVARAAFQNDALTRLLQQSGRDEALADLCAQLRRLNEGEEAAADERTKTAAAIGSALDSLLADVSILRAENATDHGRLSTEHQEIKDILLGVAPTPVKAVLPRPPRADLFLQRDGEVAATVNAVLADPPGWVAVLGEGGIGKTSVAAAALCDERVVARYGETRYFVDLSLVTDSDTLLPTVLAACGLATSGAHMGHLTRFLGDDPSLLVLDNAETPWRTGSTAFNDLLTALDAVPRLAVICTLRLNHSPGDPSHREWTTVEPPALTNEAALALVGGLAPKHRGHRALADMVAQLDGMPLALTLLGAAAAREPDMSALERRWQTERTRLLRRDDGQHRLTSLDVSVALSLSSPLLDDLAREVLAAVAWLPAGTSSEDLRLLWPEHGAAACDSLREQALLRPAAHRLDLLNPVRESLRRQLPLGDVAKASLAVHYAELIAASPVLGRPGGAQALARLLPEAPNIEAALQVLLALHPVADCWDALHGFAQLARFAGAGSVAPLSAAAAAAASARDAEEEAWCRWLIAEVQYMRAELAAATENYEISLTLFVGEEHVLGQANCTRGLANIAMARGEFDHARRLLHKASELSSRSKDSLGLANCIRSLGDIALRDEDLPLAAQRYDDAQRLFEQVDDSLGRANCIERRGQVALLQRDVGPAADLFALAGPVYEQIGHLAGQAQCHLGVGAVAFGRREYATARDHYERARHLCAAAGRTEREADCNWCLGDTLLRMDLPDEAITYLIQGLAGYERADSDIGRARCLNGLGEAAHKTGRYREAAAAYAEAAAWFEKAGLTHAAASSVEGAADAMIEIQDTRGARSALGLAQKLYAEHGDRAGLAGCELSMGDVCRLEGDGAGATRCYTSALAAYEAETDTHGAAMAHVRLAAMAQSPAEHDRHRAEAIDLWRSIDRDDLAERVDRSIAHYRPPS